MKLVDRPRAWDKAINRKPGPVALREVSIQGSKGFKDAVVPLCPNLTAICGENGTGKSTFLRYLFHALSPEKASVEFPNSSELKTVAKCEARAIVWNAPSNTDVELLGSDLIGALKSAAEGAVVYLDPSDIAQRIKRTIVGDADFKSVLEGLEPREVSTEELDILREFVGRRYESLRIYEIDDYFGWSSFPYFHVRQESGEYYSEDMGLGELCIGVMYWRLSRIPEGGVLLLEEPESHLPPRAQRALMAYLAEIARKKRIYVVFTSHSSFTLEHIPPSNLVMLGRWRGEVVVNSNPSRSILFESLQISLTRCVAMIFEDNIAMIFGRKILSSVSPSMIDEVEPSFVKGYSDLDEIGRRWPPNSGVKIICVYDGDQRPRAHELAHGYGVFLPGSVDPAIALRETILTLSGQFAAELNYNEAALKVAVGNAAGTDLKDFFPVLTRSLGLSMAEIVEAATIVWLADRDNAYAIRDFVDGVQSKLSPSRLATSGSGQ